MLRKLPLGSARRGMAHHAPQGASFEAPQILSRLALNPTADKQALLPVCVLAPQGGRPGGALCIHPFRLTFGCMPSFIAGARHCQAYKGDTGDNLATTRTFAVQCRFLAPPCSLPACIRIHDMLQAARKHWKRNPDMMGGLTNNFTDAKHTTLSEQAPLPVYTHVTVCACACTPVIPCLTTAYYACPCMVPLT